MELELAKPDVFITGTIMSVDEDSLTCSFLPDIDAESAEPILYEDVSLKCLESNALADGWYAIPKVGASAECYRVEDDFRRRISPASVSEWQKLVLRQGTYIHTIEWKDDKVTNSLLGADEILIKHGDYEKSTLYSNGVAEELSKGVKKASLAYKNYERTYEYKDDAAEESVIGVQKASFAYKDYERTYEYGESGASETVRGIEKIIINSEDDSMAIASKTAEKLNEIISGLNDFITAFNSHMHPTAATGAPSPPTVTGSAIKSISKSDIESKIFKIEK